MMSRKYSSCENLWFLWNVIENKACFDGLSLKLSGIDFYDEEFVSFQAINLLLRISKAIN